MLALYVPYNMKSSPLCVITCFTSFVLAVLAMLALCHLVWVSLLLFASLHLCLYVNACVFVCFFLSSSIVSIYDFVQAHTRLCTRNPEFLLGTLFDGTRVVRTPT